MWNQTARAMSLCEQLNTYNTCNRTFRKRAARGGTKSFLGAARHLAESGQPRHRGVLPPGSTLDGTLYQASGAAVNTGDLIIKDNNMPSVSCPASLSISTTALVVGPPSISPSRTTSGLPFTPRSLCLFSRRRHTAIASAPCWQVSRILLNSTLSYPAVGIPRPRASKLPSPTLDNEWPKAVGLDYWRSRYVLYLSSGPRTLRASAVPMCSMFLSARRIGNDMLL